MKTLSKLFMACGLIVGLAACNKEIEPQVNTPELPNHDSIYMSFNISMPATRSTTDGEPEYPSDAKPDFEIGTPDENSLTKVQLVLVDPTTKKIVAISDPTASVLHDQTYSCPIPSKDLLAIAKENEEYPLEVIAYCGVVYQPEVAKIQTEIGQPLDVNRIHPLADIDDKTLWTKGQFAMANALPRPFNLPTYNTLVTNYKTEQTAFSLGTISVERLASRFDIATDKVEFEMPDGLVKVTLKDIALYNQSKEMYVLRRTSADGQNTVTPTEWKDLFTYETASNYVVDTKAAEKNAYIYGDGKMTRSDWFVDPDAPVFTSISSLKGEDNWTPEVGNQEYTPWRYATENIMPAPKGGVNNQYKDMQTMVVFRGNISARADAPAPVQKAFTQSKPVFVFQNLMIGDADCVERAATKGLVDPEQPDLGNYKENKDLATAYTLALNKVNDNTYATLEEALKASESFDVYEAPYAVHYYYWNRHNANPDHSESGIMEFAVVRNNVYKLRVDTIMKFGTPTFEKPGKEPIETKNAFFKVNVEVLPWVVRVNNIEF